MCLQLFLQGGPAARARHKKMLQLAKGYRGRANRCFVIARNRVEKALARAYTGRKLKKRDNRTLWITKINASARLHGINYSHVRLCVFCGCMCRSCCFLRWALAAESWSTAFKCFQMSRDWVSRVSVSVAREAYCVLWPCE